MGLITLKSMKISGFRSIDEATIIFAPSGMVLIKGTNKDTNGSSGSGKSNVLLALAYAFDYCPLSLKDLQCWFLDSVPSVEVLFEIESIEYRLIRDIKPSLEYGNTKVTGSKAVNAELQTIIGLETELLAALTFRGQKARGIFLSKRDAEKKEFLTKLLKLEVFEEEYEKATKTGNLLATKLETINGRVTLLEDQWKKASSEVKEPVFQDDTQITKDIEIQQTIVSTNLSNDLRTQAIYDEFVNSITPYNNPKLDIELSQATNALMQAEKSIPQYVADETEHNRLMVVFAEVERRLKESQLAISELNVIHRDLTEVIRKKERILETINELQCKLNILQNAMCPECERPWDEGQGSIQVVISDIFRYNKELTQVHEGEEALIHTEHLQKVQNETNVGLLMARQVINSELETEQNRLDDLKFDFYQKVQKGLGEVQVRQAKLQGQLKEERATWEANLAKRKQELGQVYANAHSELLDSKLKLSDLQSLLNGKQRYNATIKADYERQIRSKNTAKESLDKSKMEFESLSREYAIEVDLARSIKGFIGGVFEESLQAIAYETNKLIGNLPNTTHITLVFKTEGISTKGTIKQEIKPVIFVNGHETSLNGCSGGQITSIELAVDLAVATVVQERTGKSPGWLILDESFDGMDLVTKEDCMALLKEYASNKLVLVVDHSSETKELFSKTIELEFSHGKTVIVN